MGQAQGRLVGGRYRLSVVVGRGGMGSVWRAHDELLDRVVAVKEVLFPPGLGAAEREVLNQRTYREARASARLNHPGVVTVHDVVQEDGRPWIVMEFVQARPLQEIIDRDGPLPPAEVAELGRQLLEALTHAHAAGILHRDVKPSNVLITDDGRAVLTDFGIAQMSGDVTLTQTGLVMGSPAYIAPERAQGDRALPGSDLWALGATLYTAVEGRSPYERGDAMAALAATLTEDPAPPRRAGRLGPVLEGLLVRDPLRRMPAAAALPLLADVAAVQSYRLEPYRTEQPYESEPYGAHGAEPYVPNSYGIQAPRPEPPGPPEPPRDDEAEQTLDDEGRFAPGAPPPFDPGAAETVKDPANLAPGNFDPASLSPSSLDAATKLEGGATPSSMRPPGDERGPGPYNQGPNPYAQPIQSPDQPWTQNAATPRSVESTDDALPAQPSGAPGRRRVSRRFLVGGITFVIGVALVVAGLLLWPRLTEQASNTGGGTQVQRSPAAAPPGYKSVSGVGFSLAVPIPWTASRTNNSTYWVAADGVTFIQVDTTAWTGTPNAHTYVAESAAKQRQNAFGDYRQIQIRDLTYQRAPATDWEFTFTDGKTKQKIHALDRFVRIGNQTFAIYFRTPEPKWSSSADRRETLHATFRASG
jgi:serine/threonine protein kinase